MFIVLFVCCATDSLVSAPDFYRNVSGSNCSLVRSRLGQMLDIVAVHYTMLEIVQMTEVFLLLLWTINNFSYLFSKKITFFLSFVINFP